jgi:murein DD-endopeptidase MepM/ murein hydrolase activator NlpD
MRREEFSVRMRAITFGLPLLVVLLLGSHARAAAPAVVLSPKKIAPGDVVLVTVKGAPGAVTGTFRGKELHFTAARSGARAILGIDLSLDPGDYPLEIAAGGKDLSRTVKVSKKKYPLQTLTLPDDKVTLSPENEARVEREQKRTAALWPVESIRLWKGRFIDPLPGRPVGTPFGVRRIINNIPKNSHSGVDITADEGELVKAPNDGVVTLVEEQFFSGKSVFLDHGDGIYTMFFHLSDTKVKPGQAVMKGDVIGLVGETGRASGAHLHWGVRMQGSRVDPLQLIRLKLD